MTTLVDARAYFGLTQSELAALLGTSTSMIKMVESGNRTLTSEHKKVFGTLSALMNEAPPINKAPAIIQEKEKSNAATALLQFIRKTLLLIRKQERALDRMHLHYEQALNRYALLDRLMKKDDLLIEKAFITQMLAKTSKALQANSPEARCLLKMKIAINIHSVEKARELERFLQAGSI